MERFDDGVSLSTSQAADLLGVHPSTVKRWSDAGDLVTERTGGGHRRILLEDALAFARAREIPTLVTPFHPHETRVWRVTHEAARGSGFAGVSELAMAWLREGRLDLVARLFETLGRHPDLAFERFCDEGIRGFMSRVGEAWRAGSLRIGEEHLASQALVESLLALRVVDGFDADTPAALVGSMEGEQHHMGALCVRLMLERLGWRVHYLGAAVPVEDFAAMQAAFGVGLVCVSFSPPHSGADMLRCVRVLAGLYDPRRPYALALGGGVTPIPGLEAAGAPLPSVGVFDSCAAFDAALHGGFGSPRRVAE